VHLVEIDGFRRFYAITRHADVMAIERRPDVFTNGMTSVLQDNVTLEAQEQLGPALRTLINMDGVDHRAHRATTADWFKPSAVRNLVAPIDGLATAAISKMIALGGTCDFVNDVALRYPLRVIMSILGVPEDDEPRMLQLTQEMFGAHDPDYSRGSGVEQSVAVIKDFMRYFWQIVAARREAPTNDLATVIANAEIDGSAMGRLETISYFVLVATAGHDTTSTAISGGLDALLDNPEQMDWLRNDPARLKLAVEEMIRWVSPVKHFMRTAQDDVEINGHQFARGDWVLLSYASANRDETVFGDPFRFDVSRANAGDHLAFGFGVHFCLGAHLSRLEIRVLFEQLLTRVRRIERNGAAEYMKTTFVGGPKRLPIRFGI
jgi:cytochrome P450